MSGRRRIVILAHILPSMVPVVRSAIDADIDVLFIGKPYSTIASTAEEMRDWGATVLCPEFGRIGCLVPEMRAFARSIKIPGDTAIFDSGGILREAYGRGIQLTRYGANNPDDIGMNPIKRAAEAPHIARAVLSQINHGGKRVMIIGDGVIGRAIKTEIGQHFDASPDIVIGATGTDISASIRELHSGKRLDLYSASSWDIEFNALLRNCPEGVRIHNRGCPVNFNRRAELEPVEGMAVTRQALLSAILGAGEFKMALDAAIEAARR